MASLLPLSASWVRQNRAFETPTVPSRASEHAKPKIRLVFLPKASSFVCKTMQNRMKPKKRARERDGHGGEEEEALKDIGDMEDLFGEREIRKIREGLLEWYDKNQRDLPWRRRRAGDGCGDEETRRAYEVWVSEVMLQQTRVQVVVDYYNRWMQKWPTIHDLAQASLEEVNEMWAGLGYYRRARFLLEGAKMIVSGQDGFPNTASALRKVKGIGDYTAGAIASIAFKEAVPVVDGNVVRVLARLRAISANPKDRDTIKNFWKLASQLVDPLRPGDLNQSLMELGATLCTPLNPSCSSCPIADQCRAHSLSKQNGSILVTDYPAKVIKAKQKHDFSCVCVVEILGKEGNQAGSRYLLVKRPDEGLLAGLWEFPTVTVDEEANIATRRKEMNDYLKKTFRLDTKKTCTAVSREDVGEFVHIFTHIRRKIYVELLVLRLKGAKNDFFSKDQEETMPWKCVDSDALSSMGLTSAVRKAHLMVQKFKQNLSPASAMAKTINWRKRKFS